MLFEFIKIVNFFWSEIVTYAFFDNLEVFFL